MTAPRVCSIDLIHFTSCPNAEAARANLRAALEALRLPAVWCEWNQDDPSVPEWVKQHGSPTILVNGEDVERASVGGAGLTCRLLGAPPLDLILAALSERNPTGRIGGSGRPLRPWPGPLLKG